MKKKHLFVTQGNRKGNIGRKNVFAGAVSTPDGKEKDMGRTPVNESTVRESPGIGIKLYEETFLYQPQSASRKQTYISCGFYSQLNNLLPMIGNGISIPTFLSNVLEHHLRTCKTEMKELFDERVKKIQGMELFTPNRGEMDMGDSHVRGSIIEYKKRFFIRFKPVQRRQTYINCDLYAKLNRFLSVVDNDISIPDFLDNMLRHHLEVYKSEMKELFEDGIGKVKF